MNLQDKIRDILLENTHPTSKELSRSKFNEVAGIIAEFIKPEAKLKYKSLIGKQKVYPYTGKDIVLYQIVIRDNSIVINTKRALEDAIKLGIIEEVKPREIWLNQYADDTNFEFSFPYQSKEEAQKNALESVVKQVKFIEVIDDAD